VPRPPPIAVVAILVAFALATIAGTALALRVPPGTVGLVDVTARPFER